MDWTRYQLQYRESYEGEDALCNDVSGCREYTCPVGALREGGEVPWEPPITGYPAVRCKAIGPDSITLLYTNYFSPHDRLSETREVLLSLARPAWSHSLGGGRYQYTHELSLTAKA